jgi:hypothetical protein
MPLLLLAMIGVDLADADCLKGLCANDAGCACLSGESLAQEDPAGGCACCILSEAAPVAMHARVADAQAPAPAAAASQPRAGVRPVPYRPPLFLS